MDLNHHRLDVDDEGNHLLQSFSHIVANVINFLKHIFLHDIRWWQAGYSACNHLNELFILNRRKHTSQTFGLDQITFYKPIWCADALHHHDASRRKTNLLYVSKQLFFKCKKYAIIQDKLDKWDTATAAINKAFISTNKAAKMIYERAKLLTFTV